MYINISSQFSKFFTQNSKISTQNEIVERLLKKVMQKISFTVKYSPVLEATVGTDQDTFSADLETEENIVVPFAFAMFMTEQAHPKLFQKYPPGKLDFKLNGEDPEQNTPLTNGDEVWFGVLK